MVLNSLLDGSDTTYCLSEKTNFLKLENSAVLNKDTEFFTPITGEGPYGYGSKIVFRFQPTGFVNWETLRFEAIPAITNVCATNLTGQFAWVKGAGTNTISDFFKRVVIKIGSTVVADIDDYNIYVTWVEKNLNPYEHEQFTFRNTENALFDNTGGNPMLGAYPGDNPTLSAGTGSGTGLVGRTLYWQHSILGNGVSLTPNLNGTYQKSTRSFNHKFGIGFLNSAQFFPAHLVGNFQLEIYLDNPSRALVGADSTFNIPVNGSGGVSAYAQALAYQLSTCRIYYDTVTLKPEFEEAVRKVVADSALYIPFLQVRSHVQSIPVGTQTFSSSVTEKVGSLKSLFYVPIYSGDYFGNYYATISSVNYQMPNQFNSLKRYCWGFPYTYTMPSQESIPNWFQLQINGVLVPSYPLQTPTEFIVQREISTGSYYSKVPTAGDEIRNCGFYSRSTVWKNQNVQTAPCFYLGSPAYYNFNSWIGFDLDRENCPELLTGYNSTLTQSDIYFTIKFNNATTGGVYTPSSTSTDTTLLIYTLFNSTMRILSNGSIDVAR